MKTSDLLKLSGVATVMALASPSEALAYVDPGTGSYLFQVAMAGGLAGLYTLRRYWHAVATAVRFGWRRKHGAIRANRSHGVD